MSMSRIHSVIVDNLTRILAEDGITRTKLAEKMRTSPSTLVPAFNTGADRVPSVVTMEKVAEALRRPLWLLLLPEAPASRVQAKGLSNAVNNWLGQSASDDDAGMSAMSDDEADLILAYRSLPADGREGLKMLLASVKTAADKPYIPLAPPGGLSAVAEPLPTSPARAKRR